MKTILIFLFVVISLALFLHFRSGDKEPQPIKRDQEKVVLQETHIEFTKHHLSELNIDLKIPKDWQVYKEISRNQFAYYFTPYRFEDFDRFLRGVSIIATKECQMAFDIKPSEQAQIYMKNAQNMNPDLKITATTSGDISVHSFTIEDKEPGPEQKNNDIFFYADDTRDILLTIVFQFETEQWEDTFPLRKTIAESIKLLWVETK